GAAAAPRSSDCCCGCCGEITLAVCTGAFFDCCCLSCRFMSDCSFIISSCIFCCTAASKAFFCEAGSSGAVVVGAAAMTGCEITSGFGGGAVLCTATGGAGF